MVVLISRHRKTNEWASAAHIYVYKNLYNGDFKETVLRIFHTAHHYKNAFVSHGYLDTIVTLLLRIVLGLVQTDGFIY